ncbi:MAG: amidohydrolase family protein, partial [Candidatus Dormibacteraeota bacterium]|nr:amidohydrolase family protein [Candidatus Dormibacteraeota bacterium]
YERVRDRFPGLPAGWLTIEHAFFADATQRRRAIDLGVSITVQHPLLYALGGNMEIYWGKARTAEVFPVREWVEEGALVAGGTDSGPAPWDPLLSIWGMVTRGTRVAGHPGPEHAIDRATAFWLYTVAGARLFGGGARGELTVSNLADLVAFPEDPLTCPIDDLPGLQPVFTLLSGTPVFDLQERLRTPRSGG